MNLTERRQTDRRQTDGLRHIANVNVKNVRFAYADYTQLYLHADPIQKWTVRCSNKCMFGKKQPADVC